MTPDIGGDVGWWPKVRIARWRQRRADRRLVRSMETTGAGRYSVLELARMGQSEWGEDFYADRIAEYEAAKRRLADANGPSTTWLDVLAVMAVPIVLIVLVGAILWRFA